MDIISLTAQIWHWISSHGELILAAVVTVIALQIFWGLHRKIIFKAWVNRYNESGTDLSKSIADLLLFKIKYIKIVHDQSISNVSLWNPYKDIPSFRQGLDEDVELMASVELGNYGKFITGLLTFLFKLIPLVIKPATIRGVIHKFGNTTIYHVVLDYYKPEFFSSSKSMLWERRIENATDADIPNHVEELAYNIYLDLTGEELFKSWEAFKYYTVGLENYLKFTNLGRNQDLEEAENYYKQALDIEKNNAAVCYNLGVLKYYKFNSLDNDEAYALFVKSINSTNLSLKARAHSGITNTLAQKVSRFNDQKVDHLKEAVNHGELAVSMDKKNDTAHKSLALAYHQMSEFEYRERLDPYDRDILRHKELAIKHYTKAYRFNRKHFIAYNNLGNLYLEWATTLNNEDPRRKTLLRKAEKACHNSLRINSSYIHAHDNLGNIYIEMNILKEAENAFLSALRYNPQYPEARNDLAVVYLLKEKSEKNLYFAFHHHAEALQLLKDDENHQKKISNKFNQYLHLEKYQINPHDNKEFMIVISKISDTKTCVFTKDLDAIKSHSSKKIHKDSARKITLSE